MAKCVWRHPPGDEIYRKGTISFFEVSCCQCQDIVSYQYRNQLFVLSCCINQNMFTIYLSCQLSFLSMVGCSKFV